MPRSFTSESIRSERSGPGRACGAFHQLWRTGSFSISGTGCGTQVLTNWSGGRRRRQRDESIALRGRANASPAERQEDDKAHVPEIELHRREHAEGREGQARPIRRSRQSSRSSGTAATAPRANPAGPS